MRKFLFILLLFMMIGCTKEYPISYDEPAKIEVVFNPRTVRSQIDPSGTVMWVPGDKIQVFHSECGYLGVLVNQNNTPSGSAEFRGELYEWTQGTMYFYYMGDNEPVILDGTRVKPLYIDYSVQDGTLVDLSRKLHLSVYSESVNGTENEFSGTLDNMISLAYYDLSNFDNNVKIYSHDNLYNLITINPDGSFQYGVAGAPDQSTGHIVVAPVKAYLAVLPHDLDHPAEVHLQFTSNNMIGADIPRTIYPSGYVNNGNIVEIQAEPYKSNFIDLPDPISDHVFTVYTKEGTISKRVIIAPSNLVYDQGRFKIHRNPWDVLSVETITVDGVLDHFPWATSGWNNKNIAFQPYTYTTQNTQYGPYNGKDYQQSIHPDKNGTNPYRLSDWGNYQFGMNVYPQTVDGRYWRVLGDNEWAQLFNRTNSQGKLWGYAQICGINGVILLPDDWTGDFWYGSTEFNEVNDWEPYKQKGAIFLPFDGDQGMYWGAKHKMSNSAGCFIMNQSQRAIVPTPRSTRCFIRLVYQTEGSVWK